MCIIIDANVVCKVFKNSDIDTLPIKNWIIEENGRLICGGKLYEEYKDCGMERIIVELSRAGKAYILTRDVVNAKQNEINSKCNSDDPHCIALAIISGARILYSLDKRLQEDFKNLQLISKPKGKIYQNVGHKHLLNHTKSCKYKQK